jgi:spermidine synthase
MAAAVVSSSVAASAEESKPAKAKGARRPAGNPPSAAAFFVLAPLMWLAVSHHLVMRTGETYFLGSYAASGAVAVGLLLGGAALGLALSFRARFLASWWLPLACVAHAALSAAALYLAFFAFGDAGLFAIATKALPLLYGLSLGVSFGAFVRVMPRILNDGSKVIDLFTFDILLGAVILIAGSLWLSRKVGSLRTGLAYACVLALVSHLGIRVIGAPVVQRKRLRWASTGVALLIGAGGAFAGFVTPWGEVAKVADAIAYAHTSDQSRVVITSGRGAFQTYVDGVYRASTLDGHRHREATVHPAMNAASKRARVLLVGGGDGFSLREILRFDDVRTVTVLEPDAGLVALAKKQPILLRENAHAFADARVRVVNEDPVAFLRKPDEPYDVIVHDVADPTGPLRSKLYTVYFFRLLGEQLAPGGVGGIQTGSPHVMRAAYWCVGETLAEANLPVRGYRADIPTFGVWGYYLFGHGTAPAIPTHALAGALHFTPEVQRAAFSFPLDETRVATEPNLLHHQVLLKYRSQAIPLERER